MRHQRERGSIQSALAKGRQPPAWYRAKPHVDVIERVILREFWRLSTERPVAGNGFGRIPFSRIREASERLGYAMFASTAELFYYLIGALDDAYCADQRARYQAEKKRIDAENKAKAASKGAPTRSRSGSRR